MKTITNLESTIKAIAEQIGFDQVGFTSLKSLKPADDLLQEWIARGRHGEMKYLENFKERRDSFLEGFPEAQSVIVLGVNYFNPTEAKEASGIHRGRVAHYAWGKDYHHVIAEKHREFILKLERELDQGVKAVSCVDSRPVPERYAATRAGFGFVGKNTMLLSRKFGPWLFLSEIVTDLNLKDDLETGGDCGTCNKCQSVCPTGALDEDYNIDARLCIAYLTIEHKGVIPRELRPKIKDWVFGCDECLTVCPFTSHQKKTEWNDFKPQSGVGELLDFDTLFSIPSNKAYQRKYQGTALLRANRKQMMRNACIVLGNSKSPEALPYLEKALTDASNLVRLHAAWALGELEMDKANDLLERQSESEEDPQVQSEIKLAIRTKSL